jgi:arsenite-transporting ATPase
LVTLAEATPVHEARALQGELERAGIHPFGWVINRALTGHALTHPQLAARQLAEARFIEEVAGLTTRPTLQPWTAELVR